MTFEHLYKKKKTNYELKNPDYLTEDEKEYLREYPDTAPENKWYDYHFIKSAVALLYDVDIQAMQRTGFHPHSLRTCYSYAILKKLGYHFPQHHKLYGIVTEAEGFKNDW